MSEQLRPDGIVKPLLTIAIPSHNRAPYLRELLEVLAEEIKDEPRVELIICDNASPDETPSVVEEFVCRGLRVRYIRNMQNIGADANILQCFEQARGKYVWIFSDDDLILPGAIAKILSYCGTAEYDLIWVSSYPFANDHKRVALKAQRDAVDIRDAVAYVKRIHVFFTFITGNIINKTTVLAAGPKPFSSLVGTSLVQLGWTYTALNRFTRGLYIREKLVAMRVNNTGGYKLFQVFGSTLATITRNWLTSENLSRIIMNGALQQFWPMILLHYKKNPRAFADEIKPQTVLTPLFKSNVRYWTFAYPVMMLPRLPATLWVFATRILNRLDKAAGFPMLYWQLPGLGTDSSAQNRSHI
jgi:abequosyltransferase